MRIFQVVPALQMGDAVGNDALAIKEILGEYGCDQTDIYAEVIDKRLPRGSGKPLYQIPKLNDDDLLLYHACTGSRLNFDLPKYGGKQIAIYHNITPPRYFHEYNGEIERIQKYAYEGMRSLVMNLDFCIADSEYNKNDLIEMGYTGPIDVCPIIIPYYDYRKEPDSSIITKYSDHGFVNFLFVGRIVPNKAQEDVVRAFYCYQKYYNPRSRLFIVGSAGGMEKYEEQLHAYVETLGLAKSVVFSGHVSFAEILAYYSIADVFICMSEHEGFCVPLVEAMLFDVPIVAYKSSAIPDTLGGGGLLLDDKDPFLVSAAINRIIVDNHLREYISNEQKKVIKRFEYDSVREQFTNCLKRIIDL